jgi:hypothetical protein
MRFLLAFCFHKHSQYTSIMMYVNRQLKIQID